MRAIADRAQSQLVAFWERLVSMIEKGLAPIESRIVSLQGDGMSTSLRIVVGEIMVAGFLLAAFVGDSVAGRSLVLVGVAAGLAVVVVRDRREAVVWLMAWLLLLGTTRRVVSLVQIDPLRDPLLAAAPVIAVLLWIRAVATGGMRRLTPLAGLTALTMGVVAVAALNPRQPSVGSAVAGVVLWGGPLLYFWIGRELDDAHVVKVARIVAGVGVVAAGYGIWQYFIGLPPWDLEWLEVRDRGTDNAYASLYLGPDTVRPVGTSTSASGFAVLMGLTATGAVAAAVRSHQTLHTRRAAGWAVVAGLAGMALLLNGTRTVMIVVIPAMIVVVSAVKGWSLIKPVLGVILLGLLAGFAMNQIDPLSLDRDGVEGNLRRIVIAFGHPTDDQYYENTTDQHLRLLADGVERGFTDPLGQGAGSIGLAGDRFGDSGPNFETDIANAAVAFGLVGFVVFTAGMIAGPWTAWRARTVPARGPDDLAPLICILVLGFTIVSLRFTFNGPHWAMSALLWLALGWADRRSLRAPDRAEGSPRSAVGGRWLSAGRESAAMAPPSGSHYAR